MSAQKEKVENSDVTQGKRRAFLPVYVLSAAGAEALKIPAEHTAAGETEWLKMGVRPSVVPVKPAKPIPWLQFWFRSQGAMDEAGVCAKL